jgi:signal transduction histidine kinase
MPVSKRELKRLARGIPVVQHKRFSPPTVIWKLVEPENGEMLGLVVVETKRRGLLHPLLALGLLLASLGAVAWPLARSLTRRLHELEATTQAFASGDLGVRAQTSPAPGAGDEVDQLAGAFNEMAGRIETLITGQRSLLANVSHELRTPLARMRVLLELLEEKSDGDVFRKNPDLERVRRGLHEIGTDVTEMDQLVGDLLTSGRLELGKQLQATPVNLHELCETAGAKVEATVQLAPELPNFNGDQLLLGRLLSNLLANARRACPDGELTLSAHPSADGLLIALEDEGPGVAPERREQIFEAFTRLDQARSRDQGGVGLGLYLSRQIARAHGGELRCLERSDGAQGARFELTLPDA